MNVDHAPRTPSATARVHAVASAAPWWQAQTRSQALAIAACGQQCRVLARWSRSPPSCCCRLRRGFRSLKVLRIAFLAAGLAIAAHVVERTVHRRSITPLSPEIGIALDAGRLVGPDAPALGTGRAAACGC